MKFIYSIKFKFTLWYLAVLSILLVLLGGGVYFTLERVLYRNLDDSLRIRADQLARFRDIIDIVAQGTFEEEIGELISFFYYSDDQLMHVSHKAFEIPVGTERIDQTLLGQSSFATIEIERIGKVRAYAVPFTPDNSRILPITDSYSAALVLARPTRDIEIALEQLLHILLAAVPLTLILAGGGGVFLAQRAFKPIRKITDTAREIGEQDLSRRIEVKTRDELGRLAVTLNQMIARLESAFKRQKEFTGDASHELRAPLAIIQAEATLALQKDRDSQAYRNSLEMISQGAYNMAGVINQLLTLARADSGKERLKFETLDLSELLDELCADAEILCQDKGLDLYHGGFEKMIVKGDKRSLRNLMHNLFSNAIRYTGRGGSVSVALKEENRMAVVSVMDTGMGIPSDQLPFIFERFYRADKARSRSEGGSGLGLAICLHIAATHGGSIDVDSQVNKGSRFNVRLPLYRFSDN